MSQWNILLFFFFGNRFFFHCECLLPCRRATRVWTRLVLLQRLLLLSWPRCQDLGWSQEDLLFDGKSLPGDYHERWREQLRLATGSQRWRVDWLLWQDEGRPLALGGEQYQVWHTQLGGPALHLHKLGPESAGQPSQPGLRPDLGLLQHSEVGRPTVQRKEVLRVWERWAADGKHVCGKHNFRNFVSLQCGERACVHYTMVYKNWLKPFGLTTKLDPRNPQNDWDGGNFAWTTVY